MNLTYPQLDAGQYFLKISGAAGGYALHFNPPLLTNGDLDLSPAPVGPGQTLTLNGSVEELTTLETYTVQINWGDGSPQTTVNLAADSSDFEATHTYAKVGEYPITATVIAASGVSGSGTDTAAIEPVISNRRERRIGQDEKDLQEKLKKGALRYWLEFPIL